MNAPDLLDEVERAPRGPKVGAFFDFDGTLIDGYSARVFYEEQIRHFELSVDEVVRSLAAWLDMALRGSDVSKLMQVAVANWAGHREEEVRELWERLFFKRIAGLVYPEARELVKAHRKARMGRNPQTGEPIQIKAKTVVKFRVAKAAKDAIAPKK